MKHDLYFHHLFEFQGSRWPHVNSFSLTLESPVPGVTAWLNGQELNGLSNPDNKGVRECTLSRQQFRQGKNVLAVALGIDAPAPEIRKPSRRPLTSRLQADLEPENDGDEVLGKSALEQLSLFRNLKRKPSFDQFPGAIILRHYQEREVICGEGEPGHSAFYILTSEDVFQLRRFQCQQILGKQAPDSFLKWSPSQVLDWIGQQGPNPSIDVKLLEQAALRAQDVTNTGEEDPTRESALACILQGQGETATHNDGVDTAYIRNDGMTDIDAKTRRTQMYEGELFGEMACMNHAARSATVVATREIYVVEFFRNILDVIRDDAQYEQRMLEIYKKRVLKTHLGRTEFFRDLTEDDIELIRQDVSLKRVKSGTVIFHEGDQADCVYIIRMGLVQVVSGTKGLDISLEPSDVKDWNALCLGLGAGDPARLTSCPHCQYTVVIPDDSYWGRNAVCHHCKQKFALINPEQPDLEIALQETTKPDKKTVKPKPRKTTKEQWLWNALPIEVQRIVRGLNHFDAPITVESQTTILNTMNQLIHDTKFVGHRDMKALLKKNEKIEQVLERVQKWTGLEIAVRGRFLMHQLFPQAISEPQTSGDSLRVLAYRGRGDLIGEMGVFLQESEDGVLKNEQQNKRNATCIAYDHPNHQGKPSEVELVVIPKATFNAVLQWNQALREKVQQMIRQRRFEMQPLSMEESSSTHSLSTLPVTRTAEYRDQGLMQGQKLMLIDLDSCTRCGDCVRGCIGTHQDGYSRLFLDGPTFGKYLVPSTCRLCLDPVCTIGCPVDAIHKGADDQIVIEDWCVGCQTCYRQCPYDSIQMHDTGVIPKHSTAWHVARAAEVSGSSWRRRKRLGKTWKACPSPFEWDLTFRSQLDFPEHSPLPAQLSDMMGYGGNILSVRLDADQSVPVPEGKTQTDVRILSLPSVAVVCDQCSNLPEKEPACVVECPHEAAFRINGRTEFPAS